MGLMLENLEDGGIRDLILEEIEFDIGHETLYMSNRLKPGLEKVYVSLLKDAASSGDCDSLASGIVINGCLLSTVPDSRTKSGVRKVPKDAHITLAEGEFNRFYIRALCRKAISDDVDLEVCRAKIVRSPRPESQMKIGQSVDPNKLLEDLRNNVGIDTALGIPAGPNSGLSVKFK